MVAANKTDFSDINLQALLLAEHGEQFKSKKEKKAEEALLASLSKVIALATDVKSGDATPSAPASSGSNGPTDGEMQEAMGELMGLLAELETKIANWASENQQASSKVGEALINEMNAQVKETQANTVKLIHREAKLHFWQIFIIVAEVVVGVLTAGVGVALGDAAMAVSTAASTALTASGALNKLTDFISQELQNAGMSPLAANLVASAMVIVATLVAAAVTFGMTAGSAVEELPGAAEEGVSGGLEGAESAANAAATDATDTVEETANIFQRAKQILTKVGQWMKSGGPFASLSKGTNMTIFMTSQAIAGTNFGGYFAEAVLSRMQDGKAKEIAQTAIEVLVDLLAALAGGEAAAASFSATATQAAQSARGLITVLQNTKSIAMATQAVGQISQGVNEGLLAQYTNNLTQSQASLGLFRQLSTMNTSQSSANLQAEQAILNGLNKALAALANGLNQAPAAVAQVLQG